MAVVSKWMHQKILKKVVEGSSIFSVIADEARDCTNKEQMPVIVCYVDKHATICEDFLTFAECPQGTNGNNLATIIGEVCKSAKLDMSKLMGQGYDGVANMAGRCNGTAL